MAAPQRLAQVCTRQHHPLIQQRPTFIKSSANSVPEYLEEIGPEQAAVLGPLIEDVRSVIHAGFEEVNERVI
ncbi:MAG: hypothetical protein ACFB0E_22585 [Leptolyngbyaceae cyanobacterium]